MLKEGGGVNGPLESRYPVNDYLDVNLWSRGWRGREKASFVVAFTRRRTKLLGFFPTKRMVRKNGLFRQVLEKKVCQASKLYKVKRFCPQQIQPIFRESNGPFFCVHFTFSQNLFLLLFDDSLRKMDQFINVASSTASTYLLYLFSGKVQTFSFSRHIRFTCTIRFYIHN